MLIEALSGAFVVRVRGTPGVSTWANLLRVVPQSGVRAKDLPALTCLSRRAMKTVLGAAVRGALVRPDGDTVHLTDAGRAVRPVAAKEIGACPPLAALVSQLELEHPHYITPYGTADVSMTGGPGVDWKPVPRRGADTAALPVASLLSQALMAFAIEYESRRRGPIVWAANMRPAAGEDSVDPASIPNAAALLRHGFAAVDPSGVLLLTSKGRAVRDAFDPLSHEIEARWRARHGDALIDAVIEAVIATGEGLPRFPVIVWTGAEFIVAPHRH
jgi:hypothetical protein